MTGSVHTLGSLYTKDGGEGRVDVGLAHGECSKSTATVTCTVVSVADGAPSFLYWSLCGLG